MKLRIILQIVFSVLIVALLFSCNSPRKTGFELQREIWESDTQPKEDTFYISGTKSIDSADVGAIKFDFHRIEIDKYPEQITAFARVFDTLGNFITNLADPYLLNPDDKYFTYVNEQLGQFYETRLENIPYFEVREFGANDSIPYNIVLSVDYSGSMTPVHQIIHQGTEIFVNMKFPNDLISLTSFSKDFMVKVPLLSDKSAIINQYRLRKDEGVGLVSGVLDAANSCMDLLEETDPEVPRVLVIFSDGDDNYSRALVQNIIARAIELKVHIFPVAFGYSKDDMLREMAKATGGKFYKAYSHEEMLKIFKDIYMSLRYFYRLTYTPPKYWGYHHIYAGLEFDGLDSALVGEGDYDTSDLWAGVGDEFTRPITFDFDQFVIKENSLYIIDEIVDAMLSRPQLRLEIQGHTDNIGTREYNIELSENRAKAVFDALVERGIDSRRLRYRGFGFSKPVATNDTEEGRAQNRRTQFVVLAK